MEFNKVNISGSAEPRVQSTQGPGAGDDNDIGQSLCSNGRHIPPTAQGPVITTALTTLSQKSSSALIQVSSVLTLHSKRMMWWLDILKKYFFSNVQCN